MKYVVGIDLGSTTTKSLVLGEDGSILGRGITNSRSNYDAACQISLSEALINARFSQVSSELDRSGLAEEEKQLSLDSLERLFRLQQFLRQLRVLREELTKVLERLNPSGTYTPSVTRILDAIERDAPALFAEGATRKSDFFRDLAGSA